jgi:CRP-like cAMP-binding protein
MVDLEALLGSVALFKPLRPDELRRVAAHFAIVELALGETRELPATPAEARAIIVARGTLKLAVGDARATLGAGDRWGELELLADRARGATVTAATPCTLAMLDRAGWDALLDEFPAIALPLASELAKELHATIDAGRELAELHASRLPRARLAAALAARKRSHVRRGARVRRSSIRAVFHQLVIRQGAEPPFWMLVGFLLAVFLARVVVALIIELGLQHELFALVPGTDPNPMHVHHFNYGLVLVGLSGIAAMSPLGRRALRALAFVFGFGCGLVLDEFALFWNLDPSYKNAHLTVAAFAAALLVQLVYFRKLWAALVRRAWNRLRGEHR